VAKRVLIAVAVLVLAVTSYWFLRPQVDTDAVATVNGEAISRGELDDRVSEVKMQYALQGVAVTSDIEAEIMDDVLEQLITERLLLQGAKRAGITITSEEVEDYYALVVGGYESEEAFLSLLADTGYSVDGVKQQIADHLALERYQQSYIEEHVPAELLVIGEDEILELYMYYSVFVPEIPPLAEIVEYLEQELRDERIAEMDILQRMIDGPNL